MNHASTLNSLATRCALALMLSAVAHTAQSAGQHVGGHTESSAIGEPGKAASVTRTVQIDMSDAMRYTPSSINAKQGETIRFAIKNSGKVKHELVLGTEKELKEHYEVMKKFPEMEHDDPNMVTVAPGKTGEVIWKFTKAGKINFACLQPGHYDAGMKGAVAVAAGKPAKGDVHAQTTSDLGKMDGVKMAQATEATEATDMTEGEVRKIDMEAGKVTLKHGEIKNLDMPGMTMVFVVKDKALLDKLKAGDKVKFKVINDAGKFTVTEIAPAK